MFSNEEILISLEPRHAENILLGVKTIELRKRKMNVKPNARIWFYAKQPVGAIVGFAFIKEIISMPPSMLWERYGDQTGICADEFFAYMNPDTPGYALALNAPTRLETSVSLAHVRTAYPKFSPPQFFKRFNDRQDKILALLNDFIYP
jgi:predicted transcriptional regulator